MAKIGQGVVKANLNRIADDLYRAVMPPSPAISQPVPGDVGAVSPEQANAMMRGEEGPSLSDIFGGIKGLPDEVRDAVKEANPKDVGLTAASESKSLDERINRVEARPKGKDIGLEI